ncbi:hypothetical protein [Acidovorax sp. Leaf78]|uniref:hypothetical protein n=1 Tax=Acidovorax sp. Leaf78 TaxID=1736237 RepID=UPI000A4E48B0|nr:hypothetical protein [Acidovorax sp. Leaf78]
MTSPPSVILLGAPGTGVQALCAALERHPATTSVRLAWGHMLDATADPAAAADAAGTTVLLMGLDQPCPDSDRRAQEAADAELRSALARAGISYRVVYGQGAQRITSALNAIKSIATSAYPSSGSGHFEPDTDPSATRTARLRAWNCEKCSDPECEHRLFTALTGRDSQSG